MNTNFEPYAPPGFVHRKLEPFDGDIVMPESWHFRGGYALGSSGQLRQIYWSCTREDPDKGDVHAQLNIDLMLGVEALSGQDRLSFCKDIIENFRVQALDEPASFPVQEDDTFVRLGLEVIWPSENGKYLKHQNFSLFAGKQMDIVVMVQYCAPAPEWDAYVDTWGVMSSFRLFGPQFSQYCESLIAGKQ